MRKRKWPESWPALKRPWELIRTSDGKPVGFFETPEEAQAVAKDAEKGHRVDTVDNIIKKIHPTGTMRGQSNNPFAAPRDPRVQGRDLRGEDD